MTNYSRGRSREYKTMHILRKDGWVCSRSAMSHGPIDVFAAKNGNVLLIQVKSGSARIKKLELEMLRKWAEEFDAQAEVWSFRKRGKPQIELVRASKRKRSRMTLRPPEVARDLENNTMKLAELAATAGPIPVSTTSSPPQC